MKQNIIIQTFRNPIFRLFVGLLVGMLFISLSRPYGWVDVSWWPTTRSILPATFGVMVMNFFAIHVQADLHANLILNKNKGPNHTGALLVRIIPIVGFSSLAHAYSWDWVGVSLLSVSMAGFWGMFFNPILNEALGKPMLYIDTDGDADGAKGSGIDKFLNKRFGARYGGIVWFLFCFAVFIASQVAHIIRTTG